MVEPPRPRNERLSGGPAPDALTSQRPRLDRVDILQLLLAVSLGISVSALLLFLLLQTLLEPQLIDESVLRITRNVGLVELVLQRQPLDALPAGVIVTERLDRAEAATSVLSGFDHRVIEALRRRFGLVREIRRDQRPLVDPWGGYWILLQVPPRLGTVWLYQAERLTSLSVWYLPILRSTAVFLGSVAGVAVFLRRRIESPFRGVMAAIPDTELPPLSLLPERGIAPLRQLSLRINRLLERLNAAASDRRQLLRGLAHDFGGPQARLMLQAEALRDAVQGEARASVDSMLEELRQLAAITGQLGVLADRETPASAYSCLALDEFCQRLVASYPRTDRPLVAVPHLLIRLDGVGLERSLCNLVDNALEYGRPPIRISAALSAGSLLIRVDDHGDGLITPTLLTMPAPARSDDRHRRRHQGLGLQLVDRYCRQQGGRLVLSTSPLGGLRAEMQLRPTAANPLFLTF